MVIYYLSASSITDTVWSRLIRSLDSESVIAQAVWICWQFALALDQTAVRLVSVQDSNGSQACVSAGFRRSQRYDFDPHSSGFRYNVAVSSSGGNWELLNSNRAFYTRWLGTSNFYLMRKRDMLCLVYDNGSQFYIKYFLISVRFLSKSWYLSVPYVFPNIRIFLKCFRPDISQFL